MLILAALVTAQDSCSQGSFDPIDAPTQNLFFIVTTDAEQQIWQYQFSENLRVETDVRLPADASQLVFNSHLNQLAYALIDVGSTNGDTVLKIYLIDIITGEQAEVFSGTSPIFTQLIGLHWTADNRLGFISNGREQQYTIVDIKSGTIETHQAGIPIPPRKTAFENPFGDWHIEFSPNFAYAAFMNFMDYRSNIAFWDLASGGFLQTDVEIPVRWYDRQRAGIWADDNNFLIMDEKLDWFNFSLQTNMLHQITDVGDAHKLLAPIIAPDNLSIAFQIWHTEPGNFDTSIAVWRGGDLIESCLTENIGQYLMGEQGWDSTSHYFAFTVYDYVKEVTNIYVFDTVSASLFNIYSLNRADARAVIVGWIDAD